MNQLTKVARLKLVYFICLLILLGGHSFQIGHKDERIDDFESDNNELRNTCAASFDSEDAIAVCMGESARVTWNSNAEGTPPEALALCEDRRDQCVEYASSGHCDSSPGWMIMNCPMSCNACHLRDPTVRCSRENLDMIQEPVYVPGQMQDMFTGIIDRFGSTYNITVLSEDPWVVTFDGFLDDSEVNALITTATDWEQSTDTGSTNEFGETGRILSQSRTSSNSWCQQECMEHPLVQQVFSKIENVTYVPRENYESFQVLRYEKGQLYKPHHDADQDDVALACGPRILTFFLYLSDVEEGGETHFPLLNLSVTPKRGKALLWPSTYDYDPSIVDPRTLHEAKPVIKGKKFAANSWIHLYDYTVPNLWGCTGVFD